MKRSSCGYIVAHGHANLKEEALAAKAHAVKMACTKPGLRMAQLIMQLHVLVSFSYCALLGKSADSDGLYARDAAVTCGTHVSDGAMRRRMLHPCGGARDLEFAVLSNTRVSRTGVCQELLTALEPSSFVLSTEHGCEHYGQAIPRQLCAARLTNGTES